jgi:hypothetical protein
VRLPQRPIRAGLILWIATAVALICPISSTAAPQEILSAHFHITYASGLRGDAVTIGYARGVEESLEDAYTLLTGTSGFGIFPGIIDVHIVPLDGGEMGLEYLEFDALGSASPVIEIASPASMEASLADMYLDITLDDAVRSTAAHELFHVIQDFASRNGIGDVSEESFVEPHATAVQEIVAPDANDYLESAIDFLLAPDSVSFFHRRYDAGIFWVFYMDRYGGPEALGEIMLESATYEGRQAIDRALAEKGVTFDDVWTAFAVAFATESLPDQDSIRSLATQIRFDLGIRSLSIPTPVATVNWTGDDRRIDHVTHESPSLLATYYEEDPVGVPLRVAHAYGIDVISIHPATEQPMLLTFSGDPGTTFSVAAVGSRNGSWETLPGGATGVHVTHSNQYAEIRLVVTRGDEGTGEYVIKLRADPS